MRTEALVDALAAVESEDATRGRIVDAAYAQMLAFGLRRTTMEDIARRAGVGKPTLYRRFTDKDAVVQAVIVRECRRSLGLVLRGLARIDTPEEQLVAGFVLATSTAARHPLIKRLLETEPEVIIPLSRESAMVIELAQARVTPFFRAFQADGHFTAVDAASAIELLVRLFMSIVLTPSAHVRADDDASLERLMRGLVLPMFTGAPLSPHTPAIDGRDGARAPAKRARRRAPS
jgi:TetR/AcrR family transcriptional regulator, repressor for uid operon